MMAPPEESVQSQVDGSYRNLFENGSSSAQSVGQGTSASHSTSPSRSFSHKDRSSTSLSSSSGGGRIHLVPSSRRRIHNAMERADSKPKFHGPAHEDASLSRRERRSALYSKKSIRPDGSLPGGASTRSTASSTRSRQRQQRPRSRSSDGLSVGRSRQQQQQQQQQQHSSASASVNTGNGRSKSASRGRYEQRWERQQRKEQKRRSESESVSTFRVGESPPLVTRQGRRRSDRRTGSIGRDTTHATSVSKQQGSAQSLEGMRIHVSESHESMGKPRLSSTSNTNISTSARESNRGAKQNISSERKRGKSAPPVQKIARSRRYGDDDYDMSVMNLTKQPEIKSMAIMPMPRDTYRQADLFGGCPGLGGFGVLGGGRRKREIAEREEQIAAMRREREEIANENAKLRDTMVRIGHRILDLEEEMLGAAARQEMELQEVKAEAEEEAASIYDKELVKVRADAEQKMEKLELERDETLVVSDRLRGELEEAVTLAEEMEEEKRISDADVRKYKQRVQDANTEIAELEREKEDLRKNEEILRVSLIGKLQQSTDKIKDLVVTNHKLMKQMHYLQEKDDESVIVEETLKVELEQAEKRIKSLEKEVDVKAETVVRPGAENDEPGAKNVNDETTTEVGRLVKAQEEEIVSLKEEAGSAEKDQAEAHMSMVSLETQKIESDENGIVTRRELEEAETEIKALKAHAGEREASFQQVQHELEAALRESNEKIISLSEEKVTKDEEVEEIRGKLAEAMDEIHRLKEEKEAAMSLDDDLQESMTRLAVVEAEKNSCDKRVIELAAMLETERLNGDKRVAELERQLSETMRKVGSHATRQEMENAGDANQRSTEEDNQLLQEQLDEACGRIKELEPLVESAKEDAKLLEECNFHIHDLEAEHAEVSERFVDLQRDFDEARAQIKRLAEEKGDGGRRKSTLSISSHDIVDSVLDGEAVGGTSREKDIHIQTLEEAMVKATKHIQKLQ